VKDVSRNDDRDGSEGYARQDDAIPLHGHVSAQGDAALTVALRQHADQHRTEATILLAVDQELGEGAGLALSRIDASTRSGARRSSRGDRCIRSG
jgi:hypothetical protein